MQFCQKNSQIFVERCPKIKLDMVLNHVFSRVQFILTLLQTAPNQAPNLLKYDLNKIYLGSKVIKFWSPKCLKYFFVFSREMKVGKLGSIFHLKIIYGKTFLRILHPKNAYRSKVHNSTYKDINIMTFCSFSTVIMLQIRIYISLCICHMKH